MKRKRSLPAIAPISLFEQQQPSPLKHFTTVECCIENIVAGFPSRSRNFSTSLRAYRFIHKQSDPIKVEYGWVYPCMSPTCASGDDGYFHQTAKLRNDRLQICEMCYAEQRKTSKNESKHKTRLPNLTRTPPITSMNQEQTVEAYKTNQVKLKRVRQSNNRLRQRLQQKGDKVTIHKVSDALLLVKKAYQYIVDKKEDAMKMIIDAVMDMETSGRIPKERQADRERYAEFIVSDITNSCQSFTGNNTQVRFHPIMANLARMNLYMGMKYEDIIDASPFVFPTVRTIQRHRATIATHEGTDPKVYARVIEMAGFSNDTEKLIHWLFDEVKLTSGVMWNAKNDEFRGLCCGTKGDVEDLKAMLEELLCDNDSDSSNNLAQARRRLVPDGMIAFTVTSGLLGMHSVIRWSVNFFTTRGIKTETRP